MTIAELQQSWLVCGGPQIDEKWDVAWRSNLVKNLELLVNQLWAVGITEIFVDGSFVEDKNKPGDIDGYFECRVEDFKRLKVELNNLNPGIWTWDDKDKRFHPDSPSKRQIPMWHSYRVELWPHYGNLPIGRDKFGNALQCPSFFRQLKDQTSLRDDEPIQKGIIKILKPGNHPLIKKGRAK